MKTAFRTLVTSLAIFIVSCQNKAPVIIKGDDGWLKDYTDPHYGELRKMRGFVHFLLRHLQLIFAATIKVNADYFMSHLKGDPWIAGLNFPRTRARSKKNLTTVRLENLSNS